MDANEEAGNQYLSRNRNEWKEQLPFSFLASPCLALGKLDQGQDREGPGPTANSASGLLSSHTIPSALGVAF